MPVDAHLLTDVRLDLEHAQLRPVYAAGMERRVVAATGGARDVIDLALTTGRANLEQAVMLRLLTPRGELAALGHADYGSRLHELVGSPNTETRRSLAKLYILESLAQEPRVAKVVRLDVRSAVGARDRVDVALDVEPAGAAETVTIGPFALSFPS